MPTIQQLIRKGRNKPPKKRKAPALQGNPQKLGVVLRVYVINPKKPNSASRHVVRVRLTNGIEVTAYFPGMKMNVAEHSVVLIQGGKAKDLPGVRYTVVRGTEGASGDPTKRQHRSLYGTPKPKQK